MSILKHSAAEWCFFRKHYDMADVYKQLSQSGYTALEMVDESRWALAKAAGLSILNMGSPGMQHGLSHVENHPALLPAIHDLIAKARANSIPQIIVFSGSRLGQPDTEGMRNCTTALKQLAGAAEAAGVTLLLELLNAYDHPDYQCDSGRYAFGVADAVGSSHVKVLYDVYHAHRMGEDVVEAIRNNVRYIGHLHIAGSPKRDFPSATQAIDYRSVIATALAVGYSGYWGQEFHGGDDPLPQFVKACPLFEGYAQSAVAPAKPHI
jgi:hydroxypyruvate isomerase